MKKILTLKHSLTLSLVFLLAGCAISFKKEKWNLPPKAENEISVMTFNVENLFDTVHDEGKNDYTYLPAALKRTNPTIAQACRDNNDSAYRVSECLTTDWGEIQLDKKLRNLSKVVLGIDGNGPDVLLLVEVENENVLNIWNNGHLKEANYKTIAIPDGPDRRGINLGVMSRFPIVGKPVLHKVPWKGKNDKDQEWMEKSRAILEVTLKAPNGDPITFFVAHFPSQANPTYWRQQAAEFLVQLMKAKGPDAMVFASGDLNITYEEESKEKIYKNIISQGGAVSHFIGCKECPGTHNYRRSWSFLDSQIYSPSILAEGTGSYEVLPSTIEVPRYDEIHLRKGKYPRRWDHQTIDGVSDHFPIYVRLKQRSEAKNPVKEAAPTKAPTKGKKSAK